jgi:hypothetical protein
MKNTAYILEVAARYGHPKRFLFSDWKFKALGTAEIGRPVAAQVQNKVRGLRGTC